MKLRRRYLYAVPIVLVAVAILFAVLSWVIAGRFVAPHHATVGSAPTGSMYDIVDAAFTTSDGIAIRGWYFPAEGKQGVVMLHGYMGSRLHMFNRAMLFRRAGFSVLIYDARASGESGGEMISFGYHEQHDLIAALEYMRSRGVVDIACLGASQGGATIAFAADRLAGVRCVVLESTYNSLEEAIERRFNHYLGIPLHPFGDLLIVFGQQRLGVEIDSMSPLQAITSLRVPLMVVTGRNDTRVPVEDARQLYDVATVRKELWLVPGADHEDLFRCAREEYEERVVGFVRREMSR